MDMNTVTDDIIKELNIHRKKLGLSWKYIAQKMEISERQLIRLRNGQCQMNIETLTTIASILGCRIKFEVL